MSQIPVNYRVQNNFSQSAKIILWHRFSSNPIDMYDLGEVQGNGAASGFVIVDGSTGAGFDYWKIQVTLANGTVWSHTSSWKVCTIESNDANTAETQVVQAGHWTIPLVTGGCTTWLTESNA